MPFALVFLVESGCLDVIGGFFRAAGLEALGTAILPRVDERDLWEGVGAFLGAMEWCQSGGNDRDW